MNGRYASTYMNLCRIFVYQTFAHFYEPPGIYWFDASSFGITVPVLALVFQFSSRSVWSVFKWCLTVSPLLNLYPYPVIAVIWFRRIRPLQKSRRDSKSSWYMIHIVETWAMALEWCLSHMHWILDEFLSALWQELQYSCGALRIFL